MSTFDSNRKTDAAKNESRSAPSPAPPPLRTADHADPASMRPAKLCDPAFREKFRQAVLACKDKPVSWGTTPSKPKGADAPFGSPEFREYAKVEIGRRLKNVGRTVPPPPPAAADAAQKRFEALVEMLQAGPVEFPDYVFPSFVSNLIHAGARSIHCPDDLLAVPLLAVAGAAIGRSGRWLQVKDGWVTSSCLWAVVLNESGGGKTPALNAIQGFYVKRQAEEFRRWHDAMEMYKADSDNNDPPGPCPTFVLNDTTLESLRTDLQTGPVLYLNDELGGWSQTMGQYKGGKGGDKFSWCSFWSHSAVHIGRKTSDRVFIEKPFVAVTGMMVPASARELNYRGHGDDGFVHRMLMAAPKSMPPRATLAGVPDSITQEYDRRMTQLFDPAEGSDILELDPEARRMIINWANVELFSILDEISPCPAYLISKYRKLYENCYRICLVLHELWRVADEDERRDEWADCRYCDEDKAAFNATRIDRITAEKAIAVIKYFQAHIPYVVALLGETVDEVDRHHQQHRGKGLMTVRQATHLRVGRDKESVMAVFAEWERRGYHW
jgi:Protein of unknown function (DUF3987)